MNLVDCYVWRVVGEPEFNRVAHHKISEPEPESIEWWAIEVEYISWADIQHARN